MNTKDYDKIISIVSKKLAKEFLSKEKGLNQRTLLLDADIAEITRKIGVETCKDIYEEILKDQVYKKNKKDL